MAPSVLDVFSLKEDENEVEASGWKVLSSDERGFAVFWVPALDKAMREGLFGNPVQEFLRQGCELS